MAQYKKYENLPWWLDNLDDNTLTPTQKEVLDLDYYCLKHGTKLSHEKAAEKLDRGRHTVYTARRRLGELILRTARRAKGSFLIGRPIEYQNEADWLAVLRARGLDPRRFKMKRKSLQKKRALRALSSSEVDNVAGSKQPAGESFSQAPRGLTNRCSGGTEAESLEQRKAKDELVRKLTYQVALGRLLEVGWPEKKAKRLAQVNTDAYMAKRNARLKSREE